MKSPVSQEKVQLEHTIAAFPDLKRWKVPRWGWVVLIVVGLVCIICGTLLALGVGFLASNYGQTHATDMYYSALKTQDYAAAYSYLGPDVKAKLSKEAFTQRALLKDATEGRVTRFSFSNFPTGDPAHVILTVTRASGTSYTVHLELRQEGGVWKVAAFDGI